MLLVAPDQLRPQNVALPDHALQLLFDAVKPRMANEIRHLDEKWMKWRNGGEKMDSENMLESKYV